MHRIIKRTVTIVTTTILKISWQEDLLHSDPPGDPGLDDFPTSESFQETVLQQFPPVMEGKEVDVSVTEPVKPQTADKPPDNAYFYQSKKGNEKP